MLKQPFGWRSVAVATLTAFLAWTALVQPPHREFGYNAYSVAAPISSDERVADYTEALAAFTALLAAFTIVLAGASLWQGNITRNALKLARDEFNATHRPKIRIRAVGFDAGKTDATQFAVKFTCINVGDAPCDIVNVRSRIDRATLANAPLFRMNLDTIELESIRTLEPGEAISFATRTYSATDAANLLPEWDVYGFVQYADKSGIRRLSGFWRRHTVDSETWSTPDNSDWNFEY